MVSCSFLPTAPTFAPSIKFNTCLHPLEDFVRLWTEWISGATSFLVACLIAASIMENNSVTSSVSPPSFPTFSNLLTRTLSSIVKPTADPIPKIKTIYHIAHPSPSTHRRTKLILQLQASTNGSRPLPAFNVIPATSLSSIKTRIKSKLRRSSATVQKDDLVVVRAEDYDLLEEDTDHDQRHAREAMSWENAIGGISRIAEDTQGLRDVAAELRLQNGTNWTVRRIFNGNYEISKSGDASQVAVARWTYRNLRTDRTSTGSAQTDRIGFSKVYPDCRQHPIIAHLDDQRISIWNKVKFMQNPEEASTYAASQETYDEMDDETEALIILSGIWVGIQEAGLILSSSISSGSGSAPFLASYLSTSQTSFANQSMSSSYDGHVTAAVRTSSMRMRRVSGVRATLIYASDRGRSGSRSRQEESATTEKPLLRGIGGHRRSSSGAFVNSQNVKTTDVSPEPEFAQHDGLHIDASTDGEDSPVENPVPLPTRMDHSVAAVDRELSVQTDQGGRSLGKWLIHRAKALGRSIKSVSCI